MSESVSNRVKDLYVDMYIEGRARAWRDAGAKDKALDVTKLWQLARLPEAPGVVEIGCGEGALANALSSLSFFSSYVGYELSRSGVEACRKRNIPRSRFEMTTGGRVPAGDDSADVAILSHVVEHLEHPRALIHEARRIAPHVIIEVPLELNARTPRQYVWDDLGHINKYNATLIRHLVQTCGLDVIAEFTMNPSLEVHSFYDKSTKHSIEWKVKEAILKVAPVVARSFFTYHQAIIARRAKLE